MDIQTATNPINQTNLKTRKIANRHDLRAFIRADANASGLSGWKIVSSPTFRFQCLLRGAEYLRNSENKFLYIAGLASRRIATNYGIKLGLTIPPNTTGPGLCIAHWGTVVIHPDSRIGANCRIHVGVVIGMAYGKTPQIGDNVYIGPGAKIFGNVKINDGSVIGANSVVTKTQPTGLIAGNPARWIRNIERWP